jgi:hypothetical protein
LLRLFGCGSGGVTSEPSLPSVVVGVVGVVGVVTADVADGVAEGAADGGVGVVVFAASRAGVAETAGVGVGVKS